MNEISIVELENRNYDKTGISNFKLTGKCIKCNVIFNYSQVKKFINTRNNQPNKKTLWNTCQKCWKLIICDEEWREKNRKAQLIAQNLSSQKAKNAIGVSKSWTKERKDKASDFLKSRWQNDPSFKEKAMKNISWTQCNDARYSELMQKSWGTGGLKGIYKSIIYESALELSFILYCNDNNILIKRYNLDAIKYKDENNKDRVYIPDFIINNNTIIEIKGYGLYYNKNYMRNILKLKALKIFSKNINMDFRLILEKDEIIKNYYKSARKLHHEIKEKNSN